MPIHTTRLERPSIAILPFDHTPGQTEDARAFVDEIGVALWRLHWFKVADPPHAQYQLRGSVRKDDRRL